MPIKNTLTNYKPSPKKKKSPFRNQIIELGSKVSSKNKRDQTKGKLQHHTSDNIKTNTKNILKNSKFKIIKSDNDTKDTNFNTIDPKSNYKSIKLSNIKFKNKAVQDKKMLNQKINSTRPDKHIRKIDNIPISKYKPKKTDDNDKLVSSINISLHNSSSNKYKSDNKIYSTDKVSNNPNIHPKFDKIKSSRNNNIFNKKHKLQKKQKLQEKMDKYLISNENIEEMYNLVTNSNSSEGNLTKDIKKIDQVQDEGNITNFKKYKSISFTTKKDNYPQLNTLYYPELVKYNNNNNNHFNKLSEVDNYICRICTFNVRIIKNNC